MSRRRHHRFSSLVAVIAATLFVASPASAQSAAKPTFHLGGFVDATIRRSSSQERFDFDLGEIDLYGTAQLSQNWMAFGEGLIQRIGEGNDADDSRRGAEADIERLYLAYSRSDALRVEAGRIYTGIVDWNGRDLRGRFLQTPVDVPAIARRQEQGGAWPLHFLGGWASGRLPGPSGLQYGVGLGEGRGSMVDDVAVFARGEFSPAGLASLSIAPDRFPGFHFGVSALTDTIPAPEGRYREIDRTISTSFVNGGIEFRSEWSRMDHRLQSDGSAHVTTGWYALLSMRLRGSLQTLRPYALLDRLKVAKDEPYLASIQDQHTFAVGTRWDAAKHLAVKLDYRFERGQGRRSHDSVRLQTAISF